ncbi:MAG: S1 family peptidase [archaeon]|nr:S1 family peptidase [archaeon]
MDFRVGPIADTPERTYSITGVVFHEDYHRSEQMSNDIGIVYLQRDFHLPPMEYPTSRLSDDSLVGATLEFVGYGYNLNSNQQEISVGVKASVKMRVAKADATTFSYSEEGKNTCNGDSGGPAFLANGAGKMVVVGITSWGDLLCTQFGVDTRVDAFAQWISQRLR